MAVDKSITDILVTYIGVPSSGAALHGAVRMKAFFDAHLKGLFAYGSSNRSLPIKPWMPRTVQKTILEVAD